MLERNHSLDTQTSNNSNIHTVSSSSNVGQINNDLLCSLNPRRIIRGVWDTGGGSLVACLLCAINFYSICRFSLLAYYLKGPFLLQFTILSVLFGLPLMSLLMTIGQYLASGFLDLWFITPPFKGIGYVFLVCYIIIAIYTSTPISWLLLYLRDSFLAVKDAPYKWGYCGLTHGNHCLNTSSLCDYHATLISSYFHHNIVDPSPSARFNLIFNTFIIWSMTFILLTQGMIKIGRTIIFIGSFSIFLFVCVCLRYIYQYGPSFWTLFMENGTHFPYHYSSWILAARECFMIWIVFGGILLTLCGHNKNTVNLFKYTSIIYIVTMTVLILSTWFVSSTINLIQKRKLKYFFSSFEDPSICFLRPYQPSSLISVSNLMIGDQLFSTATNNSGYHFTRFAFQIVPAALSLSNGSISSFWAMSYYLSSLLMALGFQIILVSSITNQIISNWFHIAKCHTLIAFVICCIGFICNLLLSTWKGIYLLYFMDLSIGSLWFISLLYFLFLVTILIVRGKPCSSGNLVKQLTTNNTLITLLTPILSIYWNCILPALLLGISLVFAKSYTRNGLSWSETVTDHLHWPIWIKNIWNYMQMLPIVVVVLYAIIKVFIELSPNFNFDKLQQLFVPNIVIDVEPLPEVSEQITDDPPPQYSPPPSYSTATAKQLLKTFKEKLSSLNIDLSKLQQANKNMLEKNDFFI